MFKFVRKIIVIIVAVYALMVYFSPQMANFVLALMLVLAVPVLIGKYIFMNILYKYSINIVAKQFIIGNNALGNEHCTVRYTPDDKIVVADNCATYNHAKRMFTLKRGKININRAWNRLCRIYDSFISLDALASFFSYDTKVEIVTLEERKVDKPTPKVNIDTSNQGPKFVDMNNVKADSYSAGTHIQNTAGAAFVELDNLKKQKSVEEKVSDAPEFVDFGDLLSTSNKIDINQVTASELSILPGINIVKAKKIIEYRDKNGLFDNVDKFIEVAEVKEHFVEKIKTMVYAGVQKETQNDNDDYQEGRIVDF